MPSITLARPMLSIRITLYGLVMMLLNFSCRQEREQAQSVTADTTVVLDADTIPFTFNPENEFLGLGITQFGDLDSMVARRKIRALVPYNHLYFYIDGKERRGVAFEALNLFEESLNKQLKFYPPKVRVLFIPVNRSQVIPLLEQGYGDLAYAGITITEERKQKVDFSTPTISGLKEIIIGSLSSPKLTSLADLAGKEVYMHKGSSYESAIIKLSDSLVRIGLKPIVVKPVDPYLETEDMLELVNAGVIPYTAAVEDIARLWSNTLDSLVLYDKIPLVRNISYGWVFRKGSPKLKAAADKFIAKNRKGTLIGNMLYNKYVTNEKILRGMHSKKTIEQVKVLRGTFQKYAKTYSLDWLLLIAQGYQESKLQQGLTSHAGAMGIMQVKPSTAAGRPINIKNIKTVDNNVHAGVKYMRFIIDQYFNDPGIDSLNRHLLALASYNAGPARIARFRKKAKAKGLDPNLWFDNVEIIAAQEIGRETVQYVSNIYKFYASYRALDYYISQRGMKIIE
jgi:membrane-bound lytic murein transglycosylase MltF